MSQFASLLSSLKSRVFRHLLILVPQALKSLFALILQIGPESGVLNLDILSGMNIGRNGNRSVRGETRVV